MSATGLLPARSVNLDLIDGQGAIQEQRRIIQHGIHPTVPTIRPDGLGGTRRPRTREESEAISDLQHGRMVLRSPQFWEVAWCLPGNVRRTGKRGKPAHYPAWVLLFLATMTTVWGSQKAAITQVCLDKSTWLAYRRLAKKHLPEGWDMPPKQPPQRHHLSYFVRLWKRPEWARVVEQAASTFRSTSIEFATELGHLPAGEKLRYDCPNPSQWIAFDGTVYKGPTNNRTRRPERVDSACGWHNKFGEERARVWGSKFVFGSLRSEDYHGRLIIDFEHVRGPNDITGIGDEGRAIVAMAKRIRAEAPGMRGVIVDGVLRDTHISELSSVNLHTINRPTAQRNPHRKTKGTNNRSRLEKTMKLTVVRHERANGRACEHHIWAIGGNLAEQVLDASGKSTWVLLTHEKVSSRRNKDGTWRHYVHATLTCNQASVPLTVPLHHQPKEGAPLKRGEVLRYYPPTSWQFGVLYGRRNDTESLHNEMKRAMPRLPAYSVAGQRLFVLAYAIRHNAATLALTHPLRT